MEKIICSAILINDGKSYKGQPLNISKGFVVCGRRHSDCYATIKAIANAFNSPAISAFIKTVLLEKTEAKDMGFITTANRFVNRREAMQIATNAGQLLFPQYHENKKPDDELFILTSEDLFPYDQNEAG